MRLSTRSSICCLVVLSVAHFTIQKRKPKAKELNEVNDGYYEGDMIDVYDNKCNCIEGFEDELFPFLSKPKTSPPGTGPGRAQVNKYGPQAGKLKDGDEKALSLPPKNLGTLWPDGIVYFQYIPETDIDQIIQVQSAMDYITEKTKGCVAFAPYDGTQQNVVSIILNGELDECASHVGMQPPHRQPQRLILGKTCTKKNGTIVHELLHTLGMYHEHTRPDRDGMIEINWSAIEPGTEIYFNKYEIENVTYPEIPFDPSSIMLLDCYAFSKDPTWLTTIGLRTDDPNKHVGQRSWMTDSDVAKVLKMYQCESR